ncbi:hypothetical protein CLI92_09275 [Vandammella animalimorsus]|uniref:Antitoxin SocA-like Panacea domain-containing protein n=1 Tax=Vandammella animalimorsus TaxID=2029117 RepID=A0A2A2T4Y7_9BURK|nr:type II toxin-antitoxin system antitoxin SocA domain-containing protein [Vandammella animalimorsus]PAT31843.1 hypothetical protein CK626_07530 [Vandammella animalimorsus]PAX16510.1 hypothetical protein CLI92_09275 [Vandammella animalimorsus]PAX18925.1 hypothetical protein CLI93_11355 [Vandammella animalimorsus]
MTVLPTVSVANFFIGKAQEEGKTITPMQVLKLVYIAHGWHLGLYDKPLIGEAAQAWKYGPVIPSVYHDFKHYGRNGIDRQKAMLVEGQPIIPTVTDTQAQEFLSAVWNAYKHLDGWQLSAITHQEGTPWSITWEKCGGNHFAGYPIANADIAQHYAELAKQRQGSRT